MIIRSGLIKNRDEVNQAVFLNHWRTVHGPLALSVPDLRAYSQNYVLRRLSGSEDERLHRVDGISQLWFDDVEAMHRAMQSPEQYACIEDIQGFLSDVTILIQNSGDFHRFGKDISDGSKFMFLLSGGQGSLFDFSSTLFAGLQRADVSGAVMRLNMICDRSYGVDPSVKSGEQIVDGVLEIWLPKEFDFSNFDFHTSAKNKNAHIIGSFMVEELALSSLTSDLDHR